MACTPDTLASPGAGAFNPMLPMLWQVRRTKKETYDTHTLELEGRAKVSLGAFSAGQFNMLYVHGIGEVPISISGDPAEPFSLVHTVRAVGAVSKAIVKMRPGDYLGVRGPYGTSWPVEEAAGMDVVLVAGGIGLAPLRPAIYRLLHERKRYCKLVLLYGTRTPADILFRREMEEWQSRFAFDVSISVDRAMGDWRGNVGVVTTLLPKARFDPENAFAMVCGPEIMMRFTVMELQKRGVPDDRIFVSLERNMKCGIGLCGHCQYGPKLVCRDGPVFSFDSVRDLFPRREL